MQQPRAGSAAQGLSFGHQAKPRPGGPAGRDPARSMPGWHWAASPPSGIAQLPQHLRLRLSVWASMLAGAALLLGCASAPPGQQGRGATAAPAGQAAGANASSAQTAPAFAGPVSALEAHGPLQLPFGSPQRWLNFPMYHDDSAHAVDSDALRWRPDTLLESGSRYPLHGKESWPDKPYAQAWYIQATRLIDCQTGRSLPQREALLGKDGEVLLERQSEREQSLRQLGNDSGSRDWLRSTEIGLACLAAGDRELLNRRREAARQAPPPLSHLPTRALLQDDVRVLRSKLPFRLDHERLQAVKTQGAAALLADVAEQRAQWRRSVFGPGSEQMQAAPLWTDDAATREALAAQINRGRDELAFRALPGWRFERWDRPREDPAPPPGVDEDSLRGTELVALQAGDCRAGMVASLQYRWYEFRNFTLVAEREATPDEALSGLRNADALCAGLQALAKSAQAEGARGRQQAADAAEEVNPADEAEAAGADLAAEAEALARRAAQASQPARPGPLANPAEDEAADEAAEDERLQARYTQLVQGEQSLAGDAELLLLLRTADRRRYLQP